jgi:hypothetical protein
MKTVIHTNENFQNGLFDADDIAYIEQNKDNDYMIALKANDEREEEIHIYRSSCAITFERNFHSMMVRIS